MAVGAEGQAGGSSASGASEPILAASGEAYLLRFKERTGFGGLSRSRGDAVTASLNESRFRNSRGHIEIKEILRRAKKYSALDF